MKNFPLNVRVIEVLTAGGFVYLAYAAQDYPFGSSFQLFRLGPALPFIIAFIWLTQDFAPWQWVSIRAIHQAMAVVTLATAGILLIGLPDSARACAF